MKNVPDEFLDLVGAPHFGHLATVNSDGSPQSSPVWIARDGDAVVFSTIEGRRKTDNMRRDPRVALSIHDEANPYRYLEIRGRAKLRASPNYDLCDALMKAYTGKDDFDFKTPGEKRVVVRVEVEHCAFLRGGNE